MLATTGVVLLSKTIIPAALVAGLGLVVGAEGILGISGLGNIPLLTLLAAVIPLILGFIVGNLDAKWTEVMQPVPNIVVPFFAFALGTGIDLRNIIAGDISEVT